MSRSHATRSRAIALLASPLLALALAPAARAGDQPPRASLTDIENDVMCVVLPRAAGGRAVARRPIAERDYIRDADRPGPDQAADRADTSSPSTAPAVLGSPPAHGFNLTVYILPPAILIAGIAIARVTLPRWRRRTARRGRDASRRPADPPLDRRRRRSASTRSSARYAATDAPSYIESGALTPSSPSASAIVRCAATDSAIRNDSTASGVAPTTRQSR